MLEKRISNDLSQTLEALSPYQDTLQAIAVESTFNWYWGETGHVYIYTPEQILAIAARQSSKLTQTEFAKLLDVSVDAIRDWEQGRRSPRGAARTLLRVAMQHPDVLRRLDPCS